MSKPFIISTFSKDVSGDYFNYFADTYEEAVKLAEDFYNEVYDNVPSFLVVDWEATWKQNLSWDFDFVDGYVFSSSF